MFKKYKIIFFIIPYHHIGGAEQVHLNIIKSLPYKPFVFFDYSNTHSISNEFNNNSYCFLVNNSSRRKYAFKFLIFFSFFFHVTIFGCNSSLFYTFISRLKGKVKAIDLTHAFSYPEYGMEIGSLPYVHLLEKRVVINNKTLNDYKKLYFERNINHELLERFEIIPNGILIKKFERARINLRFDNFTIGFVGRNAIEKRPELFFELVSKLNLKAKVIGDNFDNYKNNFPNIIYFENYNDNEVIREQFSDISILIVSSSREGFPLVIMEAMELGIPVIATDVGSISDHLINNFNGFLVPIDKSAFINLTTNMINKLLENKEFYCSLSLNARKYAEDNFDIEKIKIKYRELFYG